MSDRNITILLHRDTEDPFARVPKPLLEDPALSWKAKGILSYLLGKPQGWKAQVQDISNHGTDRGGSIRAGLKELRDAGYAKLVRVHGKDGKLVEWVLKVSDMPVFIGSEPDSEKPDQANPEVGKPDQGNRPLSKNEVTKNELNKKEGDLPLSSKRFSKPTPDQTKAQAIKIGMPAEEGQKFWNYHESRGWVMGKVSMKSWIAAMNTWAMNWKKWESDRSNGNGGGYYRRTQPNGFVNDTEY